jgi:ferredoxin--NADP+ reductase
VPNVVGRVVVDGEPVPGEYVAGWIKRGPTGVIGTNKSDAQETVTALLADAPSLPQAPERDPDAILRLLGGRGTEVVVWEGWTAIDAAEATLAAAGGRGKRVKIRDRETLLRTAAEARQARAGESGVDGVRVVRLDDGAVAEEAVAASRPAAS